ncbi:O-antigen ligase family protein [Novosphingobium aerophilum]|uniref:O-antigen ligase family protein n=1 Tax=Novosphingobium TaxID=165696 RepID=UPI002D789D55|nr:O-antigen ligase family protein [Novosphingobium sp. RL4]WRT95317.1 O-antigen ligase family protein [Novosphingobium sp. RL4]
MTSPDLLAGSHRGLTGAALLLILAVLAGGGGSGHAVAEIAIELASIAVAAWLLASPLPMRGRGALVPLALLAAWAGLAALQLVPLPAPVWRAMPGRELAAAIADHVGAGQAAHPLSLDPAATRRALAALLPAAAMLLAVAHMDLRERLALSAVAIGCALASLLLGVMQLLSAGQWGTLYPEGHLGYATGLFANRNHQASFLLVAVALACTFAARKASGSILALLLMASLAAGVIATTSRAGLLLLPVSLLPLAASIPARRLRWLAVLPLVAAGAYALAMNNAMVRIVMDRIRNGNMERLSFWQDSGTAIARFWPFGSGYGTFAGVFQTVEPLEHVGTHYVNHAHNDLLEIMLEGGMPATLLFAAGIAWWLRRGVSALRETGSARRLGIAAWTGILVLLLHSLVDYPVRMLPVELVAAMLAGFLVPPAPPAQPARRRLGPPHSSIQQATVR